jgi:hypothetical protein
MTELGRGISIFSSNVGCDLFEGRLAAPGLPHAGPYAKRL